MGQGGEEEVHALDFPVAQRDRYKQVSIYSEAAESGAYGDTLSKPDSYFLALAAQIR